MMAKILCFVGAGVPLELRETPLPQDLHEGELLVRIERAAICGSDLHTIAGRRQEHVPSTMGHEGFGVVEGSARPEISAGSRITWTLVDSCGKCPACTRYGVPQKCESLWKYGHGEDGLDGTYATHVRVRRGTAVFEVPTRLDPRLAAPANCVLATAVEAVRDVGQPGRACVLGAGMLGMFAALLLRDQGWIVTLVDSAAERREAAEQCGFMAASEPDGTCDLVVEAAGYPEPLHAAYRWLRVGGEIRIVGLTNPNAALKLSAEDIARKLWTLRGVHNYRPDALGTALETALRLQDSLPLDDWFGPVFPLERFEEAFALAESREYLRVFLAG